MGGSQDLNTVLVTLIPQNLGTSLDLGLPGQRCPRWAAYHTPSFGFSSGKARPQTISPFLPSSEIATSHKASHRQSQDRVQDTRHLYKPFILFPASGLYKLARYKCRAHWGSSVPTISEKNAGEWGSRRSPISQDAPPG